jgi:DNA-damage-inducible protein D
MNTELNSFEKIKQYNEYGIEYWSARDLQKSLGYGKWENFSKVIDKAMLACDVAGFDVKDHSPGIRKMVEIGSETKRKILDYNLFIKLQKNG